MFNTKRLSRRAIKAGACLSCQLKVTGVPDGVSPHAHFAALSLGGAACSYWRLVLRDRSAAAVERFSCSCSSCSCSSSFHLISVFIWGRQFVVSAPWRSQTAPRALLRASTSRRELASTSQRERASTSRRELASTSRRERASTPWRDRASTSRTERASTSRTERASISWRERASTSRRGRASRSGRELASTLQRELASTSRRERASTSGRERASKSGREWTSTCGRERTRTLGRERASTPWSMLIKWADGWGLKSRRSTVQYSVNKRRRHPPQPTVVDEHWNCFKGNVGGLLREGVERIRAFRAQRYHLKPVLNWANVCSRT